VAKVLLVEDTARLAQSIARGLREEGFSVEVEASGHASLLRAGRHDLDALILDLGLPDQDGVEVLLALRAAGQQMPVLVLTARDAVASRVQALEAGADDYLIKPFAFEELLARLKALLRRSSAPRWAPLACGDVRLDPSMTGAYVGERAVPLSPRERSLLELLLRRQGDTVTRAEIHREVFGYEFDPGTNVVDVHLAHLRRKLKPSTTRLETVRGQGFRLLPPAAGGRG
jgi:two-component system copper resistance phosphate regulon response regulator CusR